MFDADPNAPFVERLTGILAFLYAQTHCNRMAITPMRSEVWFEAKAYWSPEALAQRAANRKLFFDKKYPERPFIITPGDKQWPN